jgi:ATP-dependent Clp protease ATP-binding subunit ClpX
MKRRKANCSFCRKPYQEVGPLVEGPGDVFICAECVELCQSIIIQEKRRRQQSMPPDLSALEPKDVLAKLEPLVCGQDEARVALVQAVCSRLEPTSHVLLIGPSRASRLLLARALAHVVGVPFAAGNFSELATSRMGTEEVVPLFYRLLMVSDFDTECANRGILYVDGVERPEAQVALVRLWHAGSEGQLTRLLVDPRRILFVCGGSFGRLDEAITRLGRHPEQPVPRQALEAIGARPDWLDHLATIARVGALGDEDLWRIVQWVDFCRADSESV